MTLSIISDQTIELINKLPLGIIGDITDYIALTNYDSKYSTNTIIKATIENTQEMFVMIDQQKNEGKYYVFSKSKLTYSWNLLNKGGDKL